MEGFLPDVWQCLSILKILVFVYLGNMSTVKMCVGLWRQIR
ncbi:hypothetical protein CHCC20342_1034 [Bacillus licheniformis]|nr:hypothetical protein CHCC20342_1034 [Bacillus licheniformis]